LSKRLKASRNSSICCCSTSSILDLDRSSSVACCFFDLFNSVGDTTWSMGHALCALDHNKFTSNDGLFVRSGKRWIIPPLPGSSSVVRAFALAKIRSLGELYTTCYFILSNFCNLDSQ
jgi:hypothetical protein